jgi:pyruvate/2-oxoglutarate dehydrogenase complex dihydrolipoamide acyltransferase (E2) component
MIGRNMAALAALVVCFQMISPVQAGSVALVIAQAAAPATAPAADSNAAHDQSAPAAAAPATAPAATTAPAPDSKPRTAKSVLAVPACSIRYVALKISGKLNGRKWKDFRRDECGLGDITAVFPDAIAPKYANEDPDTARMHTCADQFTANKATRANGGLKWIEKDGGYYGECIGHLKG